MARLSEITGLSQAVALTRPSVVWSNLQLSLCEHCPPCMAIAYPDLNILTQQAVGLAITVLNKMVDDTDNREKVEDAENKTAVCLTRYT